VGLEIAVDDPQFMGFGQAFGNLVGDGDGFSEC